MIFVFLLAVAAATRVDDEWESWSPATVDVLERPISRLSNGDHEVTVHVRSQQGAMALRIKKGHVRFWEAVQRGADGEWKVDGGVDEAAKLYLQWDH